MTPAAQTPVIGYARVSTDEQGDSGAGLDAQEDAIRTACQARGWVLTELHRETATGATTARRPLLADAIAQLEAKDGPEAIVVAKLDRLTRSVADGARLFERSKANGWGIVALDLGVDTTTPAGELVANVMIAVGQWERRVISQRTKDALAVRKAQGVRLGRPPEIPAATLERLRTLKSEGLSLSRIADALNEEGTPTPRGATWNPVAVHKALKRHQT